MLVLVMTKITIVTGVITLAIQEVASVVSGDWRRAQRSKGVVPPTASPPLTVEVGERGRWSDTEKGGEDGWGWQGWLGKLQRPSPLRCDMTSELCLRRV